MQWAMHVEGSSFDKRAGQSPWVIRAHQAAAIAAIVHNLGREPVWRWIYCGLGMGLWAG
jgi:hypothetical protein